MRSSMNTTCRTFVWAVILMTPVQSLPAATCGCGTSNSCGEQEEQFNGCSCSVQLVRSGRCCCAKKRTAESRRRCCKSRPKGSCCRAGKLIGKNSTCCSSKNGEQRSSCDCGIDCQCGKSHQPRPTAPPVENNTAEKLASNSITIAPAGFVCTTQNTQRYRVASTARDAVGALDRCVSLCRFTI